MAIGGWYHTTPPAAEERQGDAGGGHAGRGERGVGEGVAAGVGGEREEGAGGGRGGERDDPEGAPAGGEEAAHATAVRTRGVRGRISPAASDGAHVERGGRRGRDDEEAVDPPGGAEERERAEAEVVERCGGAVHAGTMRFRKRLGTPHRVELRSGTFGRPERG